MHLWKYLAATIVLWATGMPGMAQRPPAMQLVVLGTGYPYPNGERAGPSCAVVVGPRVFVVDAGRGSVMRLAAMGNPWGSMEAAFLTHLHSDHIDGLPDLFHSTWEFGRGVPFQLYGPKGTQGVADAILQFYGADIRIRRDLTEKLPAEGAKIKAHEVKEGVVYEVPGEVKVTAFLVDHKPVEPAFGYRFDAGERSIVISGDTRPSANLVRFASGADVLLHEAYVRKSEAAGAAAGGAGGGAGGGAKPTEAWSIQDYHSSAREAGETAAKAKVKALVLTHLIPGDAAEQEFLEEAKKAFSGKVLVGRDLMVVKPGE